MITRLEGEMRGLYVVSGFGLKPKRGDYYDHQTALGRCVQLLGGSDEYWCDEIEFGTDPSMEEYLEKIQGTIRIGSQVKHYLIPQFVIVSARTPEHYLGKLAIELKYGSLADHRLRIIQIDNERIISVYPPFENSAILAVDGPYQGGPAMQAGYPAR